MIKTLSWEPFRAANMTLEQTRNAVLWGMAQFAEVSNLKIISADIGQKADIHLRGRNTNDWAGHQVGKNIWISTQRNLSARDGHILGAVLMHEICHVLGWKHTPQTAEFRNHIMHPWVAGDDWWAPSEIVRLQNTWGKPAEQFTVHEIVYLGNKLRANRSTIEAMIRVRDGLWKKHNEAKPHERFEIFEKIDAQNAKIEKLQAITSDIRGQRAKRIEYWKAAMVPKAIVPPLLKAELAAADEESTAEIAPRNMVHCGCGCEHVSTPDEPEGESWLEPI